MWIEIILLFLVFNLPTSYVWASQMVLVVKNPSANAGDIRVVSLIPRSERSPGGDQGNTSVFLPGESHGQRSLVGYSPQGCKESDTTE